MIKIFKLIYGYWMALARVLSWINTRVILIILYFLVFTPIGFIMKLFKKDVLEIKIQKEIKSYWKNIEPKELNLKNYQKQF